MCGCGRGSAPTSRDVSPEGSGCGHTHGREEYGIKEESTEKKRYFLWAGRTIGVESEYGNRI